MADRGALLVVRLDSYVGINFVLTKTYLRELQQSRDLWSLGQWDPYFAMLIIFTIHVQLINI